MINLSPEVRIMKDGSNGYFYSLQQLEQLRCNRWLTMPEQLLPRSSHAVESPFDNPHSAGDHKKNAHYGI